MVHTFFTLFYLALRWPPDTSSQTQPKTVNRELGEVPITSLSLSFRTASESWNLGTGWTPSMPSIWATPGLVVLQGSSVSIFCGGPPGTTQHRLKQAGSSREWHPGALKFSAQYQDAVSESGSWKKNQPFFESIQEGQEFLISPVFQAHAGLLNGSRHEWSTPSDFLEVLVTGMYKKPQLSALRGPSMTQHEKILQCHSETWFDVFLLSRDDSTNYSQCLKSQYKQGFFQANFTLGSKWKTRRDTYRCYGSQSFFPSLWSDPSKSLTFLGRGSVRVNVVRLSLGAMFLLLLMGIMVEAWLSQEDLHRAIKRPPALPGWDGVL
ncbi:leukocyte immunoglobulin-like receptor subfamily A member 5 [Castor canadensis]|uniref:Leukocyte immunoglobulin-like receptor subfamily A member 5 n=1 Tax=Castor canadensis TaxID=51338 RepID=A0AC58L8K6_CASCN